MAGLRWFKVSADLMRHKKSQALAGRLHDDRAWAYVVQMWAWFCEQAGHGEQLGSDAAYLVARGAGWQGDVDEFCRHMVAVGFLETVPEGFRVHDWQEWAGAHVEYQRRDAARKRTSRGQSKGSPSDIHQTSTGQVGGHPSDCPQECLSSLVSDGSVSKGGVGGSVRHRVGIGGGLPADPSPGQAEEYPLTAAVLAALWERKVSALWPVKPESARQVERAIHAAGIPAATERLAVALSEPGAKEWLSFHLDAIRGKAGKGPQPVGRDFTKTLADLE